MFGSVPDLYDIALTQPASWPWPSVTLPCWHRSPSGRHCPQTVAAREVYQAEGGYWCERFWCGDHAPIDHHASEGSGA